MIDLHYFSHTLTKEWRLCSFRLRIYAKEVMTALCMWLACNNSHKIIWDCNQFIHSFFRYLFSFISLPKSRSTMGHKLQIQGLVGINQSVFLVDQSWAVAESSQTKLAFCLKCLFLCYYPTTNTILLIRCSFVFNIARYLKCVYYGSTYWPYIKLLLLGLVS